ncbi:hypothetical protein EWM64_g2233 [Hericium alpestre]|uniref:ThuA-like domain-containing protein n=1 Tax=Hericium alpestre TaxID=135208 RepID=A0A4Z0A817_9AGAM|nr:hypothetical protein EWM64_g2233 [Hericium alpestre]
MLLPLPPTLSLLVLASLPFVHLTTAVQAAAPARAPHLLRNRRLPARLNPHRARALVAQGSALNIQFDATEDKGRFTDDGLSQYDLLVFLMNTGEVLDDTGKAALQKYLDLGGNFVGLHSASDCLRNTTFYGREVGAFFDYHPALQNATVDVVDVSHPSTSMLPAQWHVQDEMYALSPL